MNKKILNVSLTLIVILIVVIFSGIYYYINETKATSSIYEDLEVSTIPVSDVQGNKELVVNNVLHKINPFTGAFPNKAIIPFLAQNGNIESFSNEQILELGFAKATKEDWADSYKGEGEPVSISAELLDKYIKDIFSEDIKYEKGNFSNKKYGIDKNVNSFFYDAEYVPENDSYTINFIAGDGIGENYIYLFEPTISKISDILEVEIPYVFVAYSEEMVSTEIDGEVVQGFEYSVYAKCNYDSKELLDELGRFSEFDVDENGEFNSSNHIREITFKNLSKIQKVQLIYQLNEAKTDYALSQIKK